MCEARGQLVGRAPACCLHILPHKPTHDSQSHKLCWGCLWCHQWPPHLLSILHTEGPSWVLSLCWPCGSHCHLRTGRALFATSARLFLQIHPNLLEWGKSPPAGVDQRNPEECIWAQDSQTKTQAQTFQIHPKFLLNELILWLLRFHKTNITWVTFVPVWPAHGTHTSSINTCLRQAA